MKHEFGSDGCTDTCPEHETNVDHSTHSHSCNGVCESENHRFQKPAPLWTAAERERARDLETAGNPPPINTAFYADRTVARLIEAGDEAATFLEKINGIDPVDAIAADGIALRLRALLDSLR